MKWIFLAALTLVGFHAIAVDDTMDDHTVIDACVNDRDCIRRYELALQHALGFSPLYQRWLIIWTPKCPRTIPASTFQACIDARP